jgi:glycine/D-amino acid oxidase-like deaminating enzyme
VIGGGVVGASIAWGLARAGVKPLVLDEGDLARRASRANNALIFVQGKGLAIPHYALWSLVSAERWPQFASELEAETGIDVVLRQVGWFTFCFSQAEVDRRRGDMEKIATITGGRSASYEVLNHHETRDRLPGIGPSVVGSIFCPKDGHVNMLRLFHALHAALAKRKCEYHANRGVLAIEPISEGFKIIGDWGEVRARQVVLAAGIDNERLAPMVGLASPLKRNKGQIIITEKCAPIFPYPYGSNLIMQGDEGGIRIGTCLDTSTDSILTNQSISAVIAKRGILTFPALAALNIVRTWTGFRVMTPDEFPIYEQSDSAPGAFVLSGHSGVTLAANHALALAPQILAGGFGTELSAYTSRRFCVSKVH